MRHYENVHNIKPWTIDSIIKILEVEKKLVQLAIVERRTKQELVECENEKIDNYLFYLFIGSIIGIPLTLYGFFNWFKIQKIMDRKLENS